jgi:hypothetical protein
MLVLHFSSMILSLVIICGRGSRLLKYSFFIFLTDMSSSDKAKQQHITLLLHASKCPFGSAETGGNGQVFSTLTNCLEMKSLAKHIHKCISKLCDYPNCSSSKFIMSCFCSCCSLKCTSCQPVRELFKLPCRQKQKHDGEGDEVDSGCKRSHVESDSWKAIDKGLEEAPCAAAAQQNRVQANGGNSIELNNKEVDGANVMDKSSEELPFFDADEQHHFEGDGANGMAKHAEELPFYDAWDELCEHHG